MQFAIPRDGRGLATLAGSLFLAAAAAAACTDAGTAPLAPAADGAEPRAAVTTTGYTAVVGDDWLSYQTKDELRARDYFWWYRAEDVYQDVDLVPDPTFGQVVRIRFRQSDETGWAPKLDAAITPRDRVWYRWRMKFSPGYTTYGPYPTGYANSYKIAFWLWEGYEGRGEVEYSNTDQYMPFWNVKQPGGAWLQYSETVLPGSAPDFGRVATEWSDSEWYEFVIYYEKTGPTSARQHWWRRKLTSGGQVVNTNPWTYLGREFSGSTTPRVRGISLGANRNKSNPSTMYIYWGPWEVVDGSVYPNPWSMPNVSGAAATAPAPAPTLTRVSVSPDTATVAPGATRQFAATGTYSDGTAKSVAVAWSTTGGTVSSAGLYTAPSAAGTYLVVGREAGSGLADTSRVTVPAPAPQAPTLQQVVVSPASATVQTGGTVQFQAQGRYSDGSTGAVVVTWTATGGTVSASGLYTAGQTAGTFRVVATAQGAALADTAAVTVAAPPPPTQGGSYTTLLGDDWRWYTGKSALSAWYSASDLNSVDLVADPTFGQVVRLTQRAGSTASPRLTRALPAPAGRVWYRWRVRFSPGWSAGSGEWTMAQWTWSGYNGAMSAGFRRGEHLLGFSVRDARNHSLRYAEAQLPGSTGLGSVGTEFSDGQWYEYVMLWEKTGGATARAHWWSRRLTSGGQAAPGAWKYSGVSLSGTTTPQVGAVSLGAGDLGRAPAATQYVYWGPWEVVDGAQYANPFGMPGV